MQVSLGTSHFLYTCFSVIYSPIIFTWGFYLISEAYKYMYVYTILTPFWPINLQYSSEIRLLAQTDYILKWRINGPGNHWFENFDIVIHTCLSLQARSCIRIVSMMVAKNPLTVYIHVYPRRCMRICNVDAWFRSIHSNVEKAMVGFRWA